jgi:catechol 2,3-dioxygenase-like lactoylglutathione lyase family enzyme
VKHPNPVIPGCGYHHVALRANDFEATLRFYIEGLGCRLAYQWGEGDRRAAMLDTGDGNYVEVFAGGTRAPGRRCRRAPCSTSRSAPTTATGPSSAPARPARR